MKIIPTHIRERGFTILLSALVASLVLALGISVFSIAQKQLILSSTGRTSQYAFYAADTGAECALYWDIRHDSFPTSSPPATITCDGQETPLDIVDEGSGDILIEYAFEYEPNSYCVRNTVTKQSVHPRTTIHSDGFSVPCDDIESSSRVLQRSVELTY